jgi:hypothetical protein
MADKITDMIAGQMASGMPGAATPPELPAGPMAAPMSTPEPKMGSKEGALVNLAMALDLIELALPALGSESGEGQKALAAMRAISSLMGSRKPRVNELQPAEILQLLGSLPQAGNVTPEVKAAMGGPAPIVPPGAGAPPMPSAPPMPPPGAGAPPPGGIPAQPGM